MKRLWYDFFKRVFSVVMCFLLCMNIFIPRQIVTAQETQKVQGFETYKYLKVVRPKTLSYNPTGEFIFPSVIDASQHISNPLGKYYMYYAPHDAPGGICLAYADNIKGPYTEYSGNPIVTKNFQGRYNVTHVSSPYVLWMPEYNKYIMYYHGENTTNRWAYSSDGINWNYGGVSLRAGDFGTGYTECQYAKVFRYTIPGQNNKYVMLSMLLAGTGNGRKIALSISNDGKTFTPFDADLIKPNADGEVNISGPYLYQKNGTNYVIYHGSTGKMYITEVGLDFSLENHLGVFHTPISSTPDSGRAASPFFINANGTEYMFYEAGHRLGATIALAKAVSNSMINECENVTATGSGAEVTIFEDPRCSRGYGSKLNADGVNDYVEYDIYIPSAGSWNIQIRVKKQNTRGKFRLYLPQADSYVGSEHNQYSPSDTYETINIGNYTFNSAGIKKFRLVVTGKDANSLGYTLGNDMIRVTQN